MFHISALSVSSGMSRMSCTAWRATAHVKTSRYALVRPRARLPARRREVFVEGRRKRRHGGTGGCIVTAEPPHGGQKDTRAVDGTESGGVTQLAEVSEGWERRLGPLEARVACAEAHSDRALSRGARQR